MRVFQLKGAMAGAGYFAQFHAEAWQRTVGARVEAVADPDVEKARAFAAQWGIERVYADTAEMLEREKPDFLDIVTGPETHLELAKLGAAARVVVITQKPMAPTWEQSREMVECCEAAGVPLFVHENWRWQPWYREIHRLVSGGEIGNVFHLGFRMRNGDGRGAEPYRVQPYFVGMKRFLIYETLVHFLDTFRFLGGEFGEIYCHTSRVNPLIAGEDAAMIRIGFRSGAEGLIDANRISGPMPLEPTFGRLRMEGDLGMIEMDGEGRILVTLYGEKPREHVYRIPEEGYRGDSIRALQQHFYDCLFYGRPCESEGRAYLKTVRAVFAAYESAEKNEVVKL